MPANIQDSTICGGQLTVSVEESIWQIYLGWKLINAISKLYLANYHGFHFFNLKKEIIVHTRSCNAYAQGRACSWTRARTHTHGESQRGRWCEELSRGQGRDWGINWGSLFHTRESIKCHVTAMPWGVTGKQYPKSAERTGKGRER